MILSQRDYKELLALVGTNIEFNECSKAQMLFFKDQSYTPKLMSYFRAQIIICKEHNQMRLITSSLTGVEAHDRYYESCVDLKTLRVQENPNTLLFTRMISEITEQRAIKHKELFLLNCKKL